MAASTALRLFLLHTAHCLMTSQALAVIGAKESWHIFLRSISAGVTSAAERWRLFCVKRAIVMALAA